MQSACKKAAFLLASLLLFRSVAATAGEPNPSPDLQQLRRQADATLATMQTKAASWTTVEEMGAVEFQVKTVQSPGMQRYAISASRGGQQVKLTDITVRDGAWYVLDGKQACKYRPYEAPMDVPQVYLALVRSSPQVVDSGLLESKGTLESAGSSIATYRVPLDDTTKRQFETTLRQMDEMVQQAEKEGTSKPVPKDAQEARHLMQDLLAHGTPVKVDLQTGLISQCGVAGKRVWLQDFRLLQDVGTTQFDVTDRHWEDKTGPMKSDDPVDLAMIEHSGIWRPGQPAGDLEARILNVKTGESRRVPYQGALCVPICFSQDRKRVYVGGMSLGDPSLGLFEIDLETLKHRRLGLPLLGRGFVMFGAISPDGKALAVTQAGASQQAFNQQVVLVDVASGNAKPLGLPLDCAQVSWLPDGSGLVLLSRKYKRMDQVPEGFVSRMDLQGRLTLLVNADCATSLAPMPSILFQKSNDAWMTCNLEGKDVQQVLDGLPKFGFPAPSPDGNRILMINFAVPNGPRPCIIDLKTGKTGSIEVTPGLWTMPVWR